MNDDTGIYATISTAPLTNIVSTSTLVGTSINTIITNPVFDIDDFLDEHIMNRVTIDHKVQEHELMKLKETTPTYADDIKETLSRNMSRDIMKKITFTKKHDKDADVHHFIGRAWVFTEEELKQIIKEARNA
jgi:hypothetical protein